MKYFRSPWRDKPPGLPREAWIVVALMALAAAVRWYGIGARDLWLDEAYSLRFAQAPIAALFKTVSHADQHPPLYYLLLHATISIAGQSEAALRFPSLIFSVLTLPAVYLLARRAAGTRAAILAALLFALSAVHVRYAQEARMYALQTFGIAWSLVGLLSALPARAVDPSTAFRNHWESLIAGRRGGWILYALGALVALYSQNTSLLYIACTTTAVFLLAAVRRDQRRAMLLGAGVTLELIAGCWMPWAPSFFSQAGQVTEQFWIPRPDIGSVIRTLEALYMPFPGLASTVVRGALLLFLFVLLFAGIRSRVRDLCWTAPMLAVLVLGPLLLLLVSLRAPLFIPRALLWTTIPLYCFAASGLVTIPRRSIRIAGMALMIGASFASVCVYHATWEKEQWRGAAAYVASAAADGDTVLVHSASVSLPFRYYFGAREKQVRVSEVPPFSLTGAWEPRFGSLEEQSLLRQTQASPEVWLVYSHFEYSDPSRRMTAVLDSIFPRRELRRFAQIEVWHYRR